MTKDYLKTICPKCYEFSEYRANPMYMHICGICKEQYTQSDLITVVDDKVVTNEVNRLMWMLTEYATQKTVKEIKEVE